VLTAGLSPNIILWCFGRTPSASEIGRELERLGPDTTGLAEELRATLTETTDDLPW